MTDDDRSEPDREIERRLAELPMAIPVPGMLEGRVMRAMRSSRRVSRAWLAVAAVVLFASGLTAGRLLPVGGGPESEVGPGYLLLLYEHGEYRPESPSGTAARVDEYRAWARGLAERGVAIRGERLEADGVEFEARAATVARRAAPADGRLGGYFVIRASSRAEAERIAATCPHLRHGGRVVVKAILPT
jgi:hypothetical protein